jgi:hypothetical protein
MSATVEAKPRRHSHIGNPSVPLVACLRPAREGTQKGNANAGAPFPFQIVQSARAVAGAQSSRASVRPSPEVLARLSVGTKIWAALCAARVPGGAAVATTQEGKWGESDPHFAAPFFAPSPVPRGVAHAPLACLVRPVELHSSAVIRRARLRVLSAASFELTRQSGFAGNLRSSG